MIGKVRLCGEAGPGDHRRVRPLVSGEGAKVHRRRGFGKLLVAFRDVFCLILRRICNRSNISSKRGSDKDRGTKGQREPWRGLKTPSISRRWNFAERGILDTSRIMRGAAAIAAIFSPACCLGLLLPAAVPRGCSAVTRALPCRHGNGGPNMELSEGEDPSHDTASAASAAGSSTALSRAGEVLFEPAFRNCLAPLAAAGAILGPNLDNYHSAFGVLTYKDPIELSVAGHLLVTTDWW